MSDISREIRRPQRPSRNGPAFRMPRIIGALILREMATTYGKSAGGYLWAILEPVLGITLLAVMFSLALAKPGLGTNFALFYATGLLPFTMFNDICNKVAGSIRFSRPLLAYPSVTYIDAMLARILLNMLTHSVVIAIVLSGIFVIYDLPLTIDLASIMESLLLTTLLACGVGSLNCYLISAYPVWERVWQILTRPLFIISGIFYLYEFMPMQAQAVLWYNPLVHCIALMRRGLYPTYEAPYIDQGYLVMLSVGLLLMGMLLLERNHKKLLER